MRIGHVRLCARKAKQATAKTELGRRGRKLAAARETEGTGRNGTSDSKAWDAVRGATLPRALHLVTLQAKLNSMLAETSHAYDGTRVH